MNSSEEKNVVTRIKELATIEKRLVKTNSMRFIISLQEEPVLPKDVIDPSMKGSIRCTDGTFYMRYDPQGSNAKNHNYPYLIKTHDMLGVNIRVSGPTQLHKLKKILPELDWIIRNTNYSDELFLVAKTHPGLMIPFAFDVVRYQSMIVSKMNRYGINPTVYKPLVTFRFATEIPHIDVDEESFVPEKSKSRYLEALNKVEQAELASTNQ